MTIQQTVTLTLPSMSFVVEGKNTVELIAQAKVAMAQQLMDGKVPQITYSLNDANALTFGTAYEGLIVESNDGMLGIVTAVNKKSLNVTYASGIGVNAAPQFFKTSDASFEEARSTRPPSYISGNFWFEGTGGYLNDNGEIKEVVVGKISRGKAKIHYINATKTISIKEEELHLYLKDNKSDFKLL